MVSNVCKSLLFPSWVPILFSISVCLIFFLNGCASKKDVVGLQYDLNGLNAQISGLRKDLKKDTEQSLDLLKKNEEKIREIEDRIAGLKGNIKEIESRIAGFEGNIKESISPVRKNQADAGARLDNLQVQLRSLGGKIEEYGYLLDKQNRENTSLKRGYESEIKTIEAKLSGLEKRILFLEGFFISESIPSAGEAPSKEGTSEQSEEKETTESKKPTSEELYQKAYNDFKKGDITTARMGFRKYLRVFPDTEYSDNAQYWIAESFFIEKKYREAILEFEEVLRKYPKGNKAPSALLKQGLAFYMLGDKTSAGLLFEKVIKDHPGSNEAKVAKKELEKLN
ncbi:MAG: tol-pal system protein YbgF [Thermodesulfobacteriota bacterium]